MGNKQSAELTEEPKPREKRKKKGRGKKRGKEGSGGGKRGELELKLIEEAEDKAEGEGEDKKVVIDIPFEHYAFPFENVVFEGGGYRSFAYCGAVRVLEEAGIWTKVRRVAGSGSGALTGALVSVGYNSYQLHQYLSQDIHRMINDRCCGYLCLMPNLVGTLGWSPGEKLVKWLGGRMKDATGKTNITFREVYQLFNRELCVAVTNLSQGRLEYCHPKTTPDMPVITAVRMSLCTPGLQKPYWYKRGEQMEAFAQGGLLCNYPLHCYDGWWLSMKPEDNFLQKLNPLKHLPRLLDHDERFSLVNDNTIGIMLYSDLDQDILTSILEQRNRHKPAHPVATELLRQHNNKQSAKHLPSERFTTLAVALDYFLEALRENNLDKAKQLTRKDLQNVINKKGNLTDKDMEVLFGNKRTADDIFRQIGAQNQDQITISELIHHFDRKGQGLHETYLSHRRRDVRNVDELLDGLTATLAANSRTHNLIKTDMERTIGVNCHHIAATDFDLEDGDVAFLIEQGKRATKAFLQYYITKKSPPVHLAEPEDGERRSFCREDLHQYIDDELSEIIDVRDYSENHVSKVV